MDFENEIRPTRENFVTKNALHGHFRTFEIWVYTGQISKVEIEVYDLDFEIAETLGNVVFEGKRIKMAQKQHIGNFQI